MYSTPHPQSTRAFKLALVFLSLGLLRASAAQAPASMLPIWPNGAPGTEQWTQKEEWYGDPLVGSVGGLHVRNVTEPAVSVYAAPKAIATGAAAIIAPGGGFTAEAWEKEGTLMAEWLQQRGVSAFVLKYRLIPQTPGGGRGALQVAGASTSQQAALSALEQSTANQATAVTTARADLVRASLTLPLNSAALQSKVAALSSAEQALATARAEGFAKIQAGNDRLEAALVQVLQGAQGGRGGAARGGATAATPAARGGATAGNAAAQPPGTVNAEVQAYAVADGEQAMRYVRAHAATWGVDPKKVGFVGMSAGGYIALKMAVVHDAETRPDFVGSVYGCCMGEEVVAPADAPPVFLASSFSDGISFAVHAGLLKSWKAVNKPIELHMYATGGHGFGMAKTGLPNDTWIDRFGDWLSAQGLMKK